MKNKFLSILFLALILVVPVFTYSQNDTGNNVDTSTTLKAEINAGDAEFKSGSYKLLTPLGNITEVNDTSPNGFSDFVNGIIKILMALGGAITVVMIMVFGIQYMVTGTSSGKSISKDRITTALAGLILIFCSYLILYTINPDLVDIRIGGFSKIDESKWPAISFTYGEDGKIISDFKYNKADAVKDACMGEPNQNVSGKCSDLTVSGWTVKNPKNKYASTEMVTRLNEFKKLLDANTKIIGKYRITEAMPQSVKHSNSCHKTGTCVDFGFTDANLYNDISVLTYIDQSANKAKLCSVFEGLPGDNMVALAKKQGLGAGTYSWVTARHFSIYGWTGCAKK